MIDGQKNLRPSIVRIQSGESHGTGFWVKGRRGQHYILTCTHVIEPGKAVAITVYSGNETFEKSVKAEIMVQIPISKGDITLLHIAEKDIPADALHLQFLDVSFPEPQPFQAFGFPNAFSEHGRPAHGTVVNTATSNDKLPLLQLLTELDIRQGFSGGPIVHAQLGFVLGMISDGEEPYTKKADLNPYALPAKFIAKKLSEYLEAQTLHPYQAWLASLYHDVVLNDEKGMRLSDIYVEANCGIHETCVNKTRPLYKDKVAKNGFFITGTHIHDLVDKVLTGKLIENHKIKDPLLTLLLGYPGQGKTSFAKRLINQCIFKYPQRAVYFVRLRYISDTKTLLNNPFYLLEQEIIQEAKRETNSVIKVDFANALLVLDGLDELSIKSDMSSRDIDDIVLEICRNAEKFFGLRILLTSRYGYTNLDKFANRNILILQLSELETIQQKKWIKGYRIFHPESHLTEKKLETYNNEAKYLAISELITQPILLQMVATLEEDFSDATNRSAIYSKLFDQLVKRGWDKGGNIPSLRGLHPESLRHALQDMAHAIFHAEKGYLYKSALDKLPKVKAMEEALDNKIDIWRSVMVAFYLDEVRKDNRKENEDDQNHDYALEFLHKSLYEYLCAEKIWRTIKEDFNTKSRKPEYALESLWEVFGRKLLSLEIVQYLIEIIENDDNAGKDTLYQNLVHWQEEWLTCDFLPAKGVVKPLDTITAVFYGYWTVLSHVKEGINHFQEENPARLLYLLRLVLEGEQRIYVNLTAAILSGAKLSGAKLFGANLFGANLSSANLSGANLSDANLSGAKLFGANLSGTNLSRANLSGAKLSRTNLSGANLSDANLSGAKLSRTNLSGANLSDANLSGANLSSANLEGANLEDAKLSNAILLRAKLLRARLSGAILSGADLEGAKMSGADLSGADLSGAYLSGANLSSAYLEGANLEGANLSDVRGLVIEQFQMIKNLYKCKNIPVEMESTLRNTHPHLFEKPVMG